MYSARSHFFRALWTWIALSALSFAVEPSEPPEAISYRDIGKRFFIEGDFGKLYTDFEIQGVVLQPVGKGDESDMVRMEITHIRNKRIEKPRYDYIVTDSKFVVGSKLRLLVREEARLWHPEGIDAIVSSPDRSHLHELQCIASLHLRKILDGQSTFENALPGTKPPERSSSQGR
ncbi:hypothetical protein [Luteolibacter marinus]|uniref:hypothetical protein n=1 Tax=Luteolibacter marinus TaxID=2776705 RepID=UPI001D012918|nr:hypothetical protein [Luteolibacter marinus]